MDPLFGEAEQIGVSLYLFLFGLVVLGGTAFNMGYRVFSIIVICGVVALLVALATGQFA